MFHFQDRQRAERVVYPFALTMPGALPYMAAEIFVADFSTSWKCLDVMGKYSYGTVGALLEAFRSKTINSATD